MAVDGEGQSKMSRRDFLKLTSAAALAATGLAACAPVPTPKGSSESAPAPPSAAESSDTRSTNKDALSEEQLTNMRSRTLFYIEKLLGVFQDQKNAMDKVRDLDNETPRVITKMTKYYLLEIAKRMRDNPIDGFQIISSPPSLDKIYPTNGGVVALDWALEFRIGDTTYMKPEGVTALQSADPNISNGQFVMFESDTNLELLYNAVAETADKME